MSSFSTESAATTLSALDSSSSTFLVSLEMTLDIFESATTRAAPWEAGCFSLSDPINFASRRSTWGGVENWGGLQHLPVSLLFDFEQIETLRPTRIFSTLVKGISKARTKRTAAEREMVRPPMKYITTLRRLICGQTLGMRKSERPNSHHLEMWGRKRQTWGELPYGWGSSSRWGGREGQMQTRRENHSQDLHNPDIAQNRVIKCRIRLLPWCMRIWPRRGKSPRPVSEKESLFVIKSCSPAKRCMQLPWKVWSVHQISSRADHRRQQRKQGRKSGGKLWFNLFTCHSTTLTTGSTLTALPRVWWRMYPRRTPTFVGKHTNCLDNWPDQIRLVAVPWGKVELKIVGPGGSTKPNIWQTVWGPWLEPPVEPKHKGSDCNDDECQVTHAGSVTLKKIYQKQEF